jgi:hypothetical protein
MIRATVLVSLVALALAGSALAGGGRPTTIVAYQPFTVAGSLKASIRVDDTLSGSCFTGSIASPRKDAWRCTVANDLYDPCFSDLSGTATFVACPEFGSAPRTVDRIDLTEPLPANGNAAEPGTRKGLPWLVLARPYAGYCTRLTGTPNTFEGKMEYYDCGRGGSLVGRPNRSTARWTAKLLTEGDNPTLYTVRVAIAWY